MGQMDDFIDSHTVEGFGAEWKEYNQRALSKEERVFIWQKYFEIFPWNSLPQNPVGMDVGCGSGRWAAEVAPKVGKLYCVDASADALSVAQSNLSNLPNVEFHNKSVSDLPVEDNSLDFIYSLGVLHHIPNTSAGIEACVKKLKPGAPFLVYLYYRFDNRPQWYYSLWKVTDVFRRSISRLPFKLRKQVCLAIAVFVYVPLAKTAKALSKLGLTVSSFPLSGYKDCSFYTMKTDALDRFGTRLEHRFTRYEIEYMMVMAGLKEIRFSDSFPFWCAVGMKT